MPLLSPSSSSSLPQRANFVPAYIPPAALTPKTVNATINTATARVQYIPMIDLAAGPFGDIQDPTLDHDIASFKSTPPPPPIPLRDTAWRTHFSHLQSWHALTLRITASELRASHRIIIQEITATQVEELTAAKRAYEAEMLESQRRFAEMLGGRNAEIEKLARTKNLMRLDFEQLNGDLKYTYQVSLGQARALGEERERAGRLGGEVRRLQALGFGQGRGQGTGRGAEPFTPDTADDRNTDTYTSNTATTTVLTPSTPVVAIHHPNNVKRAKDIRVRQPSWTTLENLTVEAGGLPIRKARREMGLPTPKGVEETVRLISGCHWGVSDVRECKTGTGQGSGGYKRGNGSVTRSGSRVWGVGQTQGQTQGQTIGQMMTQGPRSARTLREVEAEMMLQSMAYGQGGVGVGLGIAALGAGAYTVPPNAAVEGGSGEGRTEAKDEGGQEDAGIRHQVQESIDWIVGSGRWGPGPSRPTYAMQGGNGNGNMKPRTA